MMKALGRNQQVRVQIPVAPPFNLGLKGAGTKCKGIDIPKLNAYD